MKQTTDLRLPFNTHKLRHLQAGDAKSMREADELIAKAADYIDSLIVRTSEAELELNYTWRVIREAYEAFSGETTKHKACEILENAIMGTVDDDETSDLLRTRPHLLGARIGQQKHRDSRR